MAYTFNGNEKIISFDVVTTSLDIRDLWSRYLDWLASSSANRPYAIAMRIVGGDALPGSKKLGITYFMLNGWKIRPFSANHTLTVNGNLYSEDGSSPFVQALGAYNVTIISSVSNLVDSTVQQLPEIEYASFNECVTIDVDNGRSGTLYPSGTSQSPVNNLSDAKIIAAYRGFQKIKLISDLTITSGQDVSFFKITSDTWKKVTVNDGAITTDTEFEKISLYGRLSGTWNVLIDCWVYNVTNFLGWVRGGSIERVDLAPHNDPDLFTLGSSYFDDIVPMYANVKSVLVMNTGVSVSFTNCTDICEIRNMDSGEVLNVELSGGKIILDISCIGGAAFINGIGLLINNSTIVPNIDGLLNEDLIPKAVMSYEGP